MQHGVTAGCGTRPRDREWVVPRAKEFESEFLLPDPVELFQIWPWAMFFLDFFPFKGGIVEEKVLSAGAPSPASCTFLVLLLSFGIYGCRFSLMQQPGLSSFLLTLLSQY